MIYLLEQLAHSVIHYITMQWTAVDYSFSEYKISHLQRFPIHIPMGGGGVHSPSGIYEPPHTTTAVYNVTQALCMLVTSR